MYKNLPDLESLRCFVAAAQTDSFRKAAKLVHLSPSAFTERIQKLERQIDAPLFVRSTRKISLSTEGMRLMEYAKKLLEQAEQFHHLATQEQTHVTLTMGTRYELGLSYLLPFIKNQKDQNSHQDLHLFFGDAPSLTQAILSSHIDLAFSSMRLDNPKIQSQTTHIEEYSLIASPHLSSKIHILEELSQYSLVDISGSFPLFRYFAEPHNIHPKEIFSEYKFLGTISAILYWVQHQEAVAVLPSYFIQDALKEKSITLILPKYTLHHDYFRVFWRRSHWAESTILNIVQELKKHPLR